MNCRFSCPSVALALALLGGLFARAEDSWQLRSRSNKLAAEKLAQPFDSLKSIATKMPAPQAGDWLAEHHENGQSCRAYKKSRPIRPGRKLTTIYIQPLGRFDEHQRKVLALTAEYMEIYFGIPVKTRKRIPLSAIPANARREHPSWGDAQILSTYVLHELLAKRRPKDAVAYIALTTSDLWPGKGWNFVYGQASLRKRVGVWSMYRNGNPNESDDAYALYLRRTLKTATHETGHILTMPHCIAYACNMNGANHRMESDNHPLTLCPVCLNKLCWNARIDPTARLDKLIGFLEANGLKNDLAYCRKAQRILEQGEKAR